MSISSFVDFYTFSWGIPGIIPNFWNLQPQGRYSFPVLVCIRDSLLEVTQYEEQILSLKDSHVHSVYTIMAILASQSCLESWPNNYLSSSLFMSVIFIFFRARARILGQQPFRIDFQFFSRWIPILFKLNKSKKNSPPPYGRHHLLLNTVPATLTQSYLQHNFALGLNDKSSVPNGKLHFSGLKIRVFWVFFWATNEHNSGIFRVYSGLFSGISRVWALY